MSDNYLSLYETEIKGLKTSSRGNDTIIQILVIALTRKRILRENENLLSNINVCVQFLSSIKEDKEFFEEETKQKTLDCCFFK